MLKTTLSALALAVLVAGVGMTSVDAAPKKKAVAAAPGGCTASTAMRDESRFWACYNKGNRVVAAAKPKKAAKGGCTASTAMRDESRFWACYNMANK